MPPGKFIDPETTATGETRGRVPFLGLDTLWFNTGTLCNIACAHCYIESGPRNDRLAYLGRAEARAYLDEIATLGLPTTEIGFTGGEPFMNPDILGMLGDSLAAGFRVLVLTNAMKPMRRLGPGLAALRARYGARLTLRVSLDHHTAAGHERLRGPGSWDITLDGLGWLAAEGFALAVAGRTLWPEDQAALRAGYGALFARLGLGLDAADPVQLVLFPEMDQTQPVPEITERCWAILGKSPADVMCAHSRMVIRRKGAARASVVACTLLPYDQAFELGHSLAEAGATIRLNHPHCAKFCVLGGGACSR